MKNDVLGGNYAGLLIGKRDGRSEGAESDGGEDSERAKEHCGMRRWCSGRRGQRFSSCSAREEDSTPLLDLHNNTGLLYGESSGAIAEARASPKVHE